MELAEQRPISRVHDARRQLLAGDASGALAALEGGAPFATLELVRAECLYTLQRFQEAHLAAERALDLAPNSPRAELLRELAWEMLELNQTVLPVRPIEVKNLTPSSKDDMPSAMPVPFDRSMLKSASPVIEREATDSGLVSETLAAIMTRQGKFGEARKIYIQLCRLHPEHDEYFHRRIAELDEQISEE